MGGNVKVNGFKATPILLKDRNQLKNSIYSFVRCVSEQTGLVMWGVCPPYHFSGSAEHFMGHKDDAEFIGIKETFGDIDLLIPEDGLGWVKNIVQTGSTFGPFQVVGTKMLAPEYSVLIRHFESGQVIQFDFVPKPWQGYAPSPFAVLSQNSSWEDIKAGLSGRARQLMLNSLTYSDFEGNVLCPTKKKMKIVTEPIQPFKYSHSLGLRQHHFPLDFALDTNEILYAKYTPHDVPYITDIFKIHAVLFRNMKLAKTKEVKDQLGSFFGVLRGMNKHLTVQQITKTLARAEEYLQGDHPKFSSDTIENNKIKDLIREHLRKAFR